MSRDEVVASMANKLADGAIVANNSTKKNRHKKVMIKCYIAVGVLILLITIALRNKSPQEETGSTYLKSATVLQSPFLKMKTAFNEGTISVDEYALYLNYLLVKYDSVPEQYRTPRPIVQEKQIVEELKKIWSKINLSTRKKIERDIPQLTSNNKGNNN